MHCRLIVQYILIPRWRFILFLRSKWTPQMKQLNRSLSQTTAQLICKTTLNRSTLYNIYSKLQCATTTCLEHTVLQDMSETFWMYFDNSDSPSCMVHAVKTNGFAPVIDPLWQTLYMHTCLYFCVQSITWECSTKQLARIKIFMVQFKIWIIFSLGNIEYSP